MSRSFPVSLTYDVSRELMMLQLEDTLDKAYDLKNKRVAELEKRFDKLDRQVMQLQRREMLCNSRRKLR